MERMTGAISLAARRASGNPTGGSMVMTGAQRGGIRQQRKTGMASDAGQGDLIRVFAQQRYIGHVQAEP